MASVRNHQELPPCQTAPVPASSKTDLPLAEVEPISYTGSTSVLTGLRKGNKHCTTSAGREE